MGQSRRRREQLGDQYGTPEGSNRQARLEAAALQQINRATAEGMPVLLVGTTAAAGAIAQATGLPWLHDLPEGAPCPSAVAWDWQRGPGPEPTLFRDGVLVLGPGSAELVKDPTPLLRALQCDSDVQLGLPQGARERNLQQLERYLAPEHLQEVRQLLASSTADWSRSYPPLPPYSDQFGVVKVSTVGGLLRVAMEPLEPLPVIPTQETLAMLQEYLEPECQREVQRLLAHGPETWAMRYPVAPAHASEVGTLVVSCQGDVVAVVLEGHA